MILVNLSPLSLPLDTLRVVGYNERMTTFLRIVTVIMLVNALLSAILAVDLAIAGDVTRAIISLTVCTLALTLAQFANSSAARA